MFAVLVLSACVHWKTLCSVDLLFQPLSAVNLCFSDAQVVSISLLTCSSLFLLFLFSSSPRHLLGQHLRRSGDGLAFWDLSLGSLISLRGVSVRCPREELHSAGRAARECPNWQFA